MRFAVLPPRHPRASPRSHGVPRRDVPGSVHIGIAGETAGGAPEGGLALARLRVHLPTRRAALTRERGIDILYPAGSFMLQAAHEQAPPGSQDLPVEPGLLTDIAPRMLARAFSGSGHLLDLEVFDADHIEPPGDVCAGLFRPVLAPVRLASTQPGDSEPYPLPTFRASLGAGELPLQSQQPGSLTRGQAGHAQQFTRRESRGHCHAPVDTHGLTVARCRDRIRDGGEGDMPASCPVHGYPVGLRTRWYGAGPAKPHPASFRYPDVACLPAQASYIPLLPAVPDNAESLIPSGLAPRRRSGWVPRIEECGHGLGEVPQRLLLYHSGSRSQPWVVRAGDGELPTLRKVARSARTAGFPPGVLLDREVPHVSRLRAVVPQYRFLGGRRGQAIPGHTNTIANGADFSGEVKRRVLST